MTTHPPSREIARAVRSVSVALLIIAATLWLLLIYQYIFRLPHYLSFYEGRNARLPWWLRVLFESWPWPAIVIGAAVLAMIFKEAITRPNTAVIVNAALLVAGLILILVFEAAMIAR